jgi:hypothetical protein
MNLNDPYRNKKISLIMIIFINMALTYIIETFSINSHEKLYNSFKSILYKKLRHLTRTPKR